jgi:hypothetical protein
MTSWQVDDPIEGVLAPDRPDLPEFGIQFQEGGTFTVRTGSWSYRGHPIDELVLEGSERDGTIVFTSFFVRAESVTTDTIRLPIGDFRNAVGAWIRKAPELADIRAQVEEIANPSDFEPATWSSIERGAEIGRREAAAIKGELRSTGRGSGRRPLPDDHLRPVSETYIEAFETDRRRVTQRTTERLRILLDRPDLPKSTVSYWISAARKRGWLEATQRGKASGSPGTRLIKWRDSHETEDDS